MTFNATPVLDGKNLLLVLSDESGKELIRHNPLSTALSHGDIHGAAVVPAMLDEMEKHILDEWKGTLKEFLVQRAHFRDKLLYVTDKVGTMALAESLPDLITTFKSAYRDLLWVLAVPDRQ